MAVAKSQIQEIREVVLLHLDGSTAKCLLLDLRKTEAYRRNGSFRNTIERIWAALKQ